MSTNPTAASSIARTGAPPRSVLVVVTRRIGDVLLATPLIRSIKCAWPSAAIDALVFDGTQGVIAANADLRRILAIPERPGKFRHLIFAAGLMRRYDVALSLVPGDRPTFYAFLAGRWRAGLLLDTPKERWKRRLLHRWIPFDDLNTHTVRMHLALAAALGVPSHGEIIVSWRLEDRQQIEAILPDGPEPLAVLHTYPKFNYKMWRRESWVAIAKWLVDRGYRVVLSGGKDPAEIAYIADIARDMPRGVVNTSGQLSLGASACLVGRARLFVGPDTAVTHIAAVLGVPTIALFGPTNPVKWGPWPRGHDPDANPWRRIGSQRVGNVTLLQGRQACVPCMLEGCDRNIMSYSDCLQQLPVKKVIAAIQNTVEAAG